MLNFRVPAVKFQFVVCSEEEGGFAEDRRDAHQSGISRTTRFVQSVLHGAARTGSLALRWAIPPRRGVHLCSSATSAARKFSSCVRFVFRRSFFFWGGGQRLSCLRSRGVRFSPACFRDGWAGRLFSCSCPHRGGADDGRDSGDGEVGESGEGRNIRCLRDCSPDACSVIDFFFNLSKRRETFKLNGFNFTVWIPSSSPEPPENPP